MLLIAKRSGIFFLISRFSLFQVLGRHMRDFLNGLDNLHEYLRFSYPKLRPPSFFVENENKNGLTLHYRSRRKGFVHYVKVWALQTTYVTLVHNRASLKSSFEYFTAQSLNLSFLIFF